MMPYILASLALGTACSYAALRRPAHAAALEWSGGALLIVGLGLLGASLPSFCLAA